MIRISHTVKRIILDNNIDPIEKFLKSLELKDRDKVKHILDIFYDLGLELPPPYIKPLQKHDLWEIRVQYRGNQYRILFFEYKDLLILLHGFQYKDNYPQKEIETALSLKRDLLNKLNN